MGLHFEPSFEQARRMNLDSVRLIAGTWGSALGISTVRVPEQPLAGITVDPASTVDRVGLIIETPVQSGFPEVIPTGVRVGVEEPYIGNIYAPWSINAAPESKFSSAGILPDNSDTPIGFPNIFLPVLILRLYLRPPQQVFTRRPAFYDSLKIDPPLSPDEAILRGWPIGGRRHVRVSIKLAGTGAVNFRLTGSPGGGVFPGDDPSLPIYEAPISPTVNVVSPHSFTFAVDNPNLYWLFLRAAAGLHSEGVTVRVNVEALD
jgi:hypothetical protein